MNSNQVGVIVVTYHPDGDVEARLGQMAAQGGGMIVVDNDSGAEARALLARICSRHGWGFLANTGNLGLGKALNQGVRRLAERGFSWVLTFDQDSEPSPGMSEHMVATLIAHPNRDRVTVVGANFREKNTGRPHRILRRHRRVPWWFEKRPPGGQDVSDATMVITSGSMVRVADFYALGQFDEGFFIDYVDTDFCLRCLEHGRLIVVSASARFEHALGDRSLRRCFGVTIHPTNHSALRHYYIARNRVTMWLRHGWRMPHWALSDACALGLWLFRIIAAEHRKMSKLRAMLVGTWDGLRGRVGECPPNIAKLLCD